jgi:hypothetical protein
MDTERAKATIMALASAGELPDPKRLRIIALRLGARARDAAALATLAQRVTDGHRLRVRGTPLRPDVVKIWRDEARG